LNSQNSNLELFDCFSKAILDNTANVPVRISPYPATWNAGGNIFRYAMIRNAVPAKRNTCAPTNDDKGIAEMIVWKSLFLIEYNPINTNTTNGIVNLGIESPS
jgi:hypothetical protein